MWQNHAHLPASGYLTEQPLDHFSTLRKWLLQTAETFLNHRKRRGNGSRTDRASVPTPTFLWMTEQRRSRVTCDLDVHVSVQQQVLRLEIPVDDVAVVAVLHRRQDLPELPPGLDLAQPPVLRQVVCGRTVEKKQEVISCGVASSGGLCISHTE